MAMGKRREYVRAPRGTMTRDGTETKFETGKQERGRYDEGPISC